MVHLHFSFPFLILHFINDFKMKSIVYFFCLFLVSFQGFGQVNLVPNPSFEDYAQCPVGFDLIDRAIGWTSYSESPDYFNSCAPGAFSVPSNAWGYQDAKEGNAYAYVITYDLQTLPFIYREYIGTELSQSLLVGIKYYISAFVSRPDSNITNGATNHFGFRFFEDPYSRFSPFSPDNFAHFQCDSIIYNQQNWTQVFGSFIPDTAFQFMAIGNFFDNSHTDTIDFNGPEAGYYIDAVCVSTDSVYAKTWTSVHESENSNQVKFTVNKDQVTFSYLLNEEFIVVYDITGKEVYKGTISSAKNRLDFSMFAQNIYYIKVGNYTASKLLIFH